MEGGGQLKLVAGIFLTCAVQWEPLITAELKNNARLLLILLNKDSPGQSQFHSHLLVGSLVNAFQ